MTGVITLKGFAAASSGVLMSEVTRVQKISGEYYRKVVMSI
jgi:hypothetical protein